MPHLNHPRGGLLPGELVLGDVVEGLAGGGTAPEGGGVPGEVLPGDIVDAGGLVVPGDVGEFGEVVLGEFPVGTHGVVVVFALLLVPGLVELVVVPGEAELLLAGVVELDGLVDELGCVPVLLLDNVEVPVLPGEVPGGQGFMRMPIWLGDVVV